MQNDATIHIYANGRRFVIVPVVSNPDTESLEVEPAYAIPLTLGRPTVVRLARALRVARQVGQRGEVPADRWDGEGGRWWSHHLLGLTLTWTENQIALEGLRERDSEPDIFPADTPDTTLAEKLIERLGQKLNAA
jgi:hypothetical protein